MPQARLAEVAHRPLQSNESLLLQMIAAEIVTPEEVDVLLADIGGLVSIIQRLVRD